MIGRLLTGCTPLLFLLPGLGLLYLGYEFYWPGADGRSLSSEAIVSDIVDRESKGTPYYYPQVLFVDSGNESISATTSEVASESTFHRGEHVIVRYSPSDSDNVQIDSWRVLLATGVFIGLPLALAFTALGGFLLLGLFRRN